MLFDIVLVGTLLQGVDAPIFTIEKHDGFPYCHGIKTKVSSHFLRQIVRTAHLKPVATTEWVQVESLELDNRRVLEKAEQKMLFTIFCTGIQLHAFLLEPTRSTTMRTQATNLVDACVVRVVKLHIDLPLPFITFHFEVTRGD